MGARMSSSRRLSVAGLVAAAMSAACSGGSSAQGSSTIGDAGLPSTSVDCPTAPLDVTAPPSDDSPYVWPVRPSCASPNVAWDPDGGTLSVRGLVSCTLSELAVLDPGHAPTEVVDAGLAPDGGPAGRVWLSQNDLVMAEGAVLQLHGSAVGGDVDELRLRSNPGRVVPAFVDADPSVYATLRADWGGIDINSTRITSWDTTAGRPDLSPDDGRAYVLVRSSLRGDQPFESRMEIQSSELSYLGYQNGASYGVVWRVPDGAPGPFATLRVYGDALDSHFHHNYFGGYTFGAYGMRFHHNEFDHNVGYGLDPHDDSDSLIVEDNLFHDNGTHGFICSKRCDHLQLRRNVSMNNRLNGYMLHWQATDWIVENNQALQNGGGGIVLWDAARNVIRGNVLSGNKNGILLLAGSSDNLVEQNVIDGSTSYGLYAYIEDPSVAGDGHPRRNLIVGNVFSNGHTKPINLSNADDNSFEQNSFIGQASLTVGLTQSTGNLFRDNCIPGGLIIQSTGSDAGANFTIADERRVNATMDTTSSLRAADPAGALFGDDKGQPMANAISPDGSELDTSGPSPVSAAIHVVQLPVAVTVDIGQAKAQVDAWSTTDVAVTISPGSSNQRFGMTFSMLQPSAAYDATLNGTSIGSGRVDASGDVTITLPVALPEPGDDLHVALRVH